VNDLFDFVCSADFVHGAEMSSVGMTQNHEIDGLVLGDEIVNVTHRGITITRVIDDVVAPWQLNHAALARTNVNNPDEDRVRLGFKPERHLTKEEQHKDTARKARNPAHEISW
jgi:hypothetical protein